MDSAMEKTLRTEIAKYVQNEFLEEDDDIEVKQDTKLISGGIVDSFSMVSLKRFLEKKYKIGIPDAKATPDAFDSVNNMIELLKEYL
jgi:acyl carrier protein